ncbi:MAG: hypothetical protein LBT59_30320 [Clostridiales bacterium]|nr:hypothetical protein [Clostridiales bacterium]
MDNAGMKGFIKSLSDEQKGLVLNRILDAVPSIMEMIYKFSVEEVEAGSIYNERLGEVRVERAYTARMESMDIARESRENGPVNKNYEDLDEVDYDDVADDVFEALEALEHDALRWRSGSTRFGFVQPQVAAWEMFEEALSAFAEGMKLSQKRGWVEDAKAYCIGIIRGIRRYKNESRSIISDWLPDAQDDYYTFIIGQYMDGNPSAEDIAEVKRERAGDSRAN